MPCYLIIWFGKLSLFELHNETAMNYCISLALLPCNLYLLFRIEKKHLVKLLCWLLWWKLYENTGSFTFTLGSTQLFTSLDSFPLVFAVLKLFKWTLMTIFDSIGHIYITNCIFLEFFQLIKFSKSDFRAIYFKSVPYTNDFESSQTSIFNISL